MVTLYVGDETLVGILNAKECPMTVDNTYSDARKYFNKVLLLSITQTLALAVSSITILAACVLRML